MPRETDHLIRLHRANKANETDQIHDILVNDGILADTLEQGAGFGELSAMTKVRRGASIVASEGSTCYSTKTVDTLVVTSEDLVSCLEKRRKCHSKSPYVASAEVMDFLRQTGLVHQATIVDVMQAAANITKKTYQAGSLLYRQGDPVDKAYIILSGEIFLDVGKFTETADYFQTINANNCYTLTSGSILGDEGMVGLNRTYDATAVVISENSVVFEIEGFAIDFLGGRLGVEKYSALLYKDKSIEFEACDYVLGEIVIHSVFNSLRKVISSQNPYRRISRPVYTFPQEEHKQNKPGQTMALGRTDDAGVHAIEGSGHAHTHAHAGHKESEATVDGGGGPVTSSVSKTAHHQHRPGIGTMGGGGGGSSVMSEREHAHTHTVLSSGGLHHLRFIRRGLKRREVLAMREVAEVSRV